MLSCGHEHRVRKSRDFFSEIIAQGIVWSIRDDGGFPTSTSPFGVTAIPFWPLESRAQKVIDNVGAYRGFRTCRLELSEFMERWLLPEKCLAIFRPRFQGVGTIPSAKH
ncbi:DUF2750 domain-containing protein [Sinorhizobium sp. 6-70]|uniref:DUF2750 domain-containing protein n=1 Tax=Sinorhizobium sp. 6-70 TaxID=3049088 RepID=UPI0034DF1789